MLSHGNSMAIDYGQPVNCEHPLNRGLRSWHLTLPNWRGGVRWRDLCSRFHGTLTAMAPATDWGGQTHPGGFGSLNFAGTDDAVDTATGTIPTTNATGTMMAWVKLANTSGIMKFLGVGDGTNGFAMLSNGLSWGSQHNEVSALNHTMWGSTSTAWNHVIGTFDTVGANTLLTLYVNGVAQTSSGTTGSSIGAANRLRIGARNDTWNLGLIGRIDDVRTYNRALTAAEAQAAYEASRLSWPGALRRVPMLWGYDPGGAPAPTVRQLAALGVG